MRTYQALRILNIVSGSVLLFDTVFKINTLTSSESLFFLIHPLIWLPLVVVLEIIQHFVYQISGSQRPFQDLVNIPYWLQKGAKPDWKRPLGGAIGKQLRKLRSFL